MISLPTRWRSAGQNFLYFAVVVGSPAERGDVVGERVEPDVDDVLFVAGDGDAPVEAGAGDGEVAQAALDEAMTSLRRGLGADELRVGLVVLEQRRSKAESLKK